MITNQPFVYESYVLQVQTLFQLNQMYIGPKLTFRHPLNVTKEDQNCAFFLFFTPEFVIFFSDRLRAYGAGLSDQPYVYEHGLMRLSDPNLPTKRIWQQCQ